MFASIIINIGYSDWFTALGREFEVAGRSG